MPRWAKALVREVAAPLKESEAIDRRRDAAPHSDSGPQSQVRIVPRLKSIALPASQSGSNAGELYVTLRPRVARMARTLLRTVPPDELVHDACVDAALSAFRFRGECAFSSWLYVVVARHVQKWLRTEHRHRNLVQEFDYRTRLDSAIPPDDAVIARGLVARLNGALATLSERQRICLILVRVEELSVHEVAKQLGVTPEAVRMNVHRARARMRKYLV